MATAPVPLVLAHGGSFDGRCWEPTVGRLRSPALAIDLPGRGRHPEGLDGLTLERAAASVVADIDAAGFEQVVLVGHSLAGCWMPAAVELLGDRLRHAVFVAATVPPHGKSALDMVPAEIRELAAEAMASSAPARGTLDLDLARAVFGNDMDDEQFAWCAERMVPEAMSLPTEPVDLTPLQRPFPRTWIRTVHDAIVAPEDQLRYAEHAGGCEVVDLDAAHMCMITKPAELAALLDAIAGAP
jgi:pimeloyl-ACP methyl ester carboxylesterase